MVELTAGLEYNNLHVTLEWGEMWVVTFNATKTREEEVEVEEKKFIYLANKLQLVYT